MTMQLSSCATDPSFSLHVPYFLFLQAFNAFYTGLSEHSLFALGILISTKICTMYFYCHPKGVLAIRRIFSLVDMITISKFSNCPYVFKIGVVSQKNMHSRQQNMRFTI